MNIVLLKSGFVMVKHYIAIYKGLDSSKRFGNLTNRKIWKFCFDMDTRFFIQLHLSFEIELFKVGEVVNSWCHWGFTNDFLYILQYNIKGIVSKSSMKSAFYHFPNFKQFYLEAQMELNKKSSIHIDAEFPYLSIGEVSKTFRGV